MASRNLCPRLEALEGRLALSGGVSAAVVKPHHIALNGQVSGSYTPAPDPDPGRSHMLAGSGTVSPLQQVTVWGKTIAVEYARGRATALILLSNDSGMVTLQMVGPIQKRFAPLPEHFTFKIISAIGKYYRGTDTGKATLTEAQVPGSSAMTYTLTLHSS